MNRFILSMLICSAGPAWADNADQQSRKSSATQKINDVTGLVQNYGLQKVALDTYFYGPKGVNTLASQWLSESQKIVNASSALSTLQNVSDSKSALQGLKILEKFYSEQGPVVANLKGKSQDLKSSALRVEKLSSSAKAMPAPKTEELKFLHGQLEESRVRSENATRTIRDSVHNLEPKILGLLSTSRPILIGKLKKMILENGWKDLEGPLAEATALLTFESEARPMITQLESIETRLTDATTNFAYFKATDTMTEADRACAEFNKKIEAMSLSEKYKVKALDRKVAVCNAASIMWKSFLQSGFNKQEMVKEFGATKKADYADKCKKPSPAINCEKFAILASIPASAIDKMTDEQLRFYEDGWYGLEKSL